MFAVRERVRIKFGAYRGWYGVVLYKGGDDGTYYGVLVDGLQMGYSEYELAKEL